MVENETNPISDVFKDLTNNQRMSVINMLQIIGVSDVGQGDSEKERVFLNSFIDVLKVPFSSCSSYFETQGFNKMLTDLQTLAMNEKELLAYISWEMIVCDGNPNETEVGLAVKIFSNLGISEEDFVKVIEKNRAIIKLFNK